MPHFNMFKAVYLGLMIAISASLVAEDAPKDAKPDPAPVVVGDWQKLETKLVPLANPRQVLSPGYFDATLQHVITFPKAAKGKEEEVVWVETGLPHAGHDASGKAYPAIKARLSGDFIWLDVNGDGKPSKQETARLNPEGCSDPLTLTLHYEDGSAAPYIFCFKTIAEKEKYAIVRSSTRSVTFRVHNHDYKLTLFDENGNGRYDDVNKDGLQVDDLPVAFLGKYVQIGNDFFELLIHAAGTSIEIRPAPKLETGVIDLFSDYKPSQKGDSIQLHSVLISGPQGSFAFNHQHPSGKVPVGEYDLAFALIERVREVVYVKKGQMASFNVNGKDVTKVKWGGKIACKFELSHDGQNVFVTPPFFEGEGLETYHPENIRNISLTASIYQVFRDALSFPHFERMQNFGMKKFEVRADGSLKPIEFLFYRNVNDQYQVDVNFVSGIMGSGFGKERIAFVFKRKDPKEPKIPDGNK